MRRFIVIEAPRAAPALLADASLSEALAFATASVGRPEVRPLVLFPDHPAVGAPEPVMVAVPLSTYRVVEALAEGVVADWDRIWLLIDSTTASRREEARDDLVGAVAVALLSAAVTGVDDAEPDEAP